jgi:hypothetical protein
MKKIKLFLVALLTCFCCVALSSCGLILNGLYLTAGMLGWVLDEDKNAPSLDELRMPVEITEGAEIVEITQNEDGYYLAKTVGAIKSLGAQDSDDFKFQLSYYDVNGYLLDTFTIVVDYLGVGDTYKVEYEAELFFEPASARIWNVELYASYDYSIEKSHKENVEVVEGETLTCTLGEDGLYHATVTGQVKLLDKWENTMCVRVAFYDANGYMYLGEWSKTVQGPAERTYTIECTSDAEIVSHKVVYASTIDSNLYY